MNCKPPRKMHSNCIPLQPTPRYFHHNECIRADCAVTADIEGRSLLGLVERRKAVRVNPLTS